MPKSISSTSIKNFFLKPWVIIAGLFLLCAISYAPLASALGLYWDDWPSLWFLHFYGPEVFPQAFAIDRPVQGWLFAATTKLLGDSLLAWQIFGIFARTLSAVTFGWVLLSLWPKRKVQVLSITILFMLYPGFAQQYIAVTYGHQFLIMSAFFISLGLMVWSARRRTKAWILTVLSLLVGLLSMFALEYYYGLELLRPALLWIIVGETIREPQRRLFRTIKLWLPFLVVDGLFLAWRLTHSTPRGEVTIFSNLAADPIGTLQRLIQTIAVDIYESTGLAWAKVFGYFNAIGIKQSVMTAYFIIMIAAGLLAFGLLLIVRSTSQKPDGKRKKDQWWRSAVLLGLIALLVGGWPVWVTDLRLELNMPWDRFTQPMMVGTSLLLVGLIDLLRRPQLAKLIIVAALAGLAAGNHFHDALKYRQEWSEQRSFFWQLAWRAPAIQSGTAFMTAGLPFFSSTDNSLSAPLNWIYAPDLKSRNMPFAMYDVEARLGNTLPGLEPDIPLHMDYRATTFDGNTSQALVLHYNPPRCLKILDLKTDRHYPNKGGYIVLAMPLSKLNLIQESGSNSAVLPDFLGPEPNHSWCYYFEKVELAVQLGQWEKASKLAQQALGVKPELTSDNAPELIPLIYAFARSGDYTRAKELSLQAGSLSKKMHYYTCDTWYYLDQEIQDDPGFQQNFSEINQKFDCDNP